MLTTRGETYEFKVRKRKPNDAYRWDEDYSLVFYGRPANQMEKKNYRIQKGVNGSTDSTFILSSNLPADLKVGDKVAFLGKEWTVQSIGYYFESSYIVNANILSEEQIIERCPKGVNIQ